MKKSPNLFVPDNTNRGPGINKLRVQFMICACKQHILLALAINMSEYIAFLIQTSMYIVRV